MSGHISDFAHRQWLKNSPSSRTLSASRKSDQIVCGDPSHVCEKCGLNGIFAPRYERGSPSHHQVLLATPLFCELCLRVVKTYYLESSGLSMRDWKDGFDRGGIMSEHHEPIKSNRDTNARGQSRVDCIEKVFRERKRGISPLIMR